MMALISLWMSWAFDKECENDKDFLKSGKTRAFPI